MGSSMGHIYDKLNEEQYERDLKYLEDLSNSIKSINPNSSDFTDIKWMIDNKDRIIGNRKLIELLR
jgi:uncharacterized protein YqfB (UPF0267 family)